MTKTLRRIRFALLIALLLVVAAPTVRVDDVKDWTPDTTFLFKRVGPVEPSPDGTRVAFGVGRPVLDGEKSEWVTHIHVARADGSEAFQLTQGDKSASSPRWSRDGAWIGFVSSRSGKANVYRIRIDGGEAERITDEKGDVAQFRWAPDGESIAFLMTDPKTDDEEKRDKEKRDARVVDEGYKYRRLYIVPVEKNDEGKRPSRLLTKDDIHVFDLDWSPDGKTIAIGHQATPKVFAQTDVSVVDVASGERKALLTTPAHERSATFSRDGKWLAVAISDNPPTWGDTARAHVLPVDGGTPRPLANTLDQQPGIVGWSPDDSRVYIREIRGTIARLSALPVDGKAPIDIGPADLSIDGATFNAAGTTLGFTSSAPDRAPEAYVTKLDRFEPVQVSKLQDAGGLPFGRTDVITWKSTDGQPIEGLLTYPVGYQKGTRVPLLVVVHGGPAGVFTRSFTGSPSPYPIAMFAARGYAVLRCNVRGSSGYGRKFRYANYRDWGGGDYRDIMSGVDHVIALGVADSDRLGVMGWSYGGYMTSWIITQTKRFKAASVGAGVTNLVSFTGTADIPGFLPDYFGGEYWEAAGELWRARSAIFNVKGVTTPTLIQHGDKDERVPISQGYELYNALVRQKAPAKMVVYPRQPHGIQEPKLTKDAMERNLEWFDQWIMKKSSGTKTTSAQ